MFYRLLSRREMARWCAVLVAGLLFAGTAAWGRAQLQAGARLRTDTLRLHILADTDRPADQTAKLCVRDLLLAQTDAHCPSSGKDAALRWAARSLPALELRLRQALARLGLKPAVHMELVSMYFDATRYADASLPAGRYDAVRIVLGSNIRSGKNWWCVLYPGLCRSACGSYARPDENSLVCGEYLVRFWLVDTVQRLAAPRGDVTLFCPDA